jgi:hypothetical protein
MLTLNVVGVPKQNRGETASQSSFPQSLVRCVKGPRWQLDQRGVIGFVKLNLFGCAFVVGGGVCNTPNLYEPTVGNEVSAVSAIKRQDGFVGMFDMVLEQPVINSEFVCGTNQMPIVTRKTFASIPPIASDLYSSPQKAILDGGIRYSIHRGNRCDGLAAPILIDDLVHLKLWLWALASALPNLWSCDAVLNKPVLNCTLVYAVHIGYFLVGAVLLMDHAFQVFLCWLWNTTVRQAAPHRSSGNRIGGQPTSDSDMTNAIHFGNGSRGESINQVQLFKGLLVWFHTYYFTPRVWNMQEYAEARIG